MKLLNINQLLIIMSCPCIAGTFFKTPALCILLQTVLHKIRPSLLLYKYLLLFPHRLTSNFFQVEDNNILILPLVHFVGSSCLVFYSFTYFLTTFISYHIFERLLFPKYQVLYSMDIPPVPFHFVSYHLSKIQCNGQNLHCESSVYCTVFWKNDTKRSEKARVEYPWNTTPDTQEIISFQKCGRR